MNYIVKSIIILLLYLVSMFKTTGQEVKSIPNDSIINTVNKYYAQNVKIFQANSTVQDIDDVFKLFTDDFTYIHPKYGGTYTRQKLYDGYIRNKKNGGYNGSIIDIKIVNMIAGVNAVAVERKYINKTENGPEDGEYQMTLFEFTDGKISKIFEYW